MENGKRSYLVFWISTIFSIPQILEKSPGAYLQNECLIRSLSDGKAYSRGASLKLSSKVGIKKGYDFFNQLNKILQKAYFANKKLFINNDFIIIIIIIINY